MPPATNGAHEHRAQSGPWGPDPDGAAHEAQGWILGNRFSWEALGTYIQASKVHFQAPSSPLPPYFWRHAKAFQVVLGGLK